MKYYLSAIFGTLFISTFTQASELTSFDDEILKARGIDLSVAQKLASAPKFLPGEQPLKVYINSEYRDDMTLLFDKEGNICITDDDLKAIGLIAPFRLQKSRECLDLKSLWPTSKLIEKPSAQAIWLSVPENAIDLTKVGNKSYGYGGYGGIFNYSAHYMGGANSSSKDMYFVNSEAGFNADNWIFRSLQLVNHTSKTEFYHRYAYAQTTLEEIQKNLQLGQINLSNGVVGTSGVIGAQIFPEMALEGKKVGGNATVSGIASESSMIEIYQSGRLIYNTAVPAGAFELSQFNLLNYTSDLKVIVKGVNGSIQDFIVPASTFRRSMLSSDTGVTFGIGRYDDDKAKRHPLVASFSKGIGIFSLIDTHFGTVFTSDYYNAGINFSTSINNAILINFGSTIAHDNRHQKTGELISSSIGYSLSDSFSLGLNGLYQGSRYHYLSDSVNDYSDNATGNNRQKQIGLDVNWSHDIIGALSSSFGRTYNIDDRYQDYASISWNKLFFDNYLLSGTFQRNYTVENNVEDAFYLRLSIPLNRANISMWLNHSDNTNRMGTRYNNYEGHDRNWSVAYEHNDNSHYQAISGNINAVTPYTQISGNIRRSNDNQTYWGASLSGGSVWVKEGFLLSPYEVKDTFGIAKAGNKRFIRIESSAGPTWTNGDGYAVLPSLIPYSLNPVRVDTRTLSRHNEIQNAYKTVNPAKGTITKATFSVTDSRRLRVNIKFNNKPLPENSVINDEAGNFITLATKPGEIFLSNGVPGQILHIETPDRQSCILQLNILKQPEPGVLYEEINEECRN